MGASPRVSNCTITQNTAILDGGGVYLGITSATISHCTIRANAVGVGGQQGEGGGVYMHQTTAGLSLSGCTISGNTSNYFCGGMYRFSAEATIASTVLCGNSSPYGPQVNFPTDGWEDSCVSVECVACWTAGPDFNLDGVVSGADIAYLLGAWGIQNPPVGDLTGDGVVDGQDLAALISHWGPVP